MIEEKDLLSQERMSSTGGITLLRPRNNLHHAVALTFPDLTGREAICARVPLAAYAFLHDATHQPAESFSNSRVSEALMHHGIHTTQKFATGTAQKLFDFLGHYNLVESTTMQADLKRALRSTPTYQVTYDSTKEPLGKKTPVRQGHGLFATSCQIMDASENEEPPQLIWGVRGGILLPTHLANMVSLFIDANGKPVPRTELEATSRTKQPDQAIFVVRNALLSIGYSLEGIIDGDRRAAARKAYRMTRHGHVG